MKHTFKAPWFNIIRPILYVIICLVFLYLLINGNINQKAYIAVGVLLVYLIIHKEYTFAEVDTIAKTFTVHYRIFFFLIPVQKKVNYTKADWETLSNTSFELTEGKTTVALAGKNIGKDNISKIADVLIESVNQGYDDVPVMCPVCGSSEVTGLLEKPVPFFTREAECQCCLFASDVDLEDDGDPDFIMFLREDWIKDNCKNVMLSDNKKSDWSVEKAISQLNNLKQLNPAKWPYDVARINPNWTPNFNEQEVREHFKND